MTRYYTEFMNICVIFYIEKQYSLHIFVCKAMWVLTEV